MSWRDGQPPRGGRSAWLACFVAAAFVAGCGSTAPTGPQRSVNPPASATTTASKTPTTTAATPTASPVPSVASVDPFLGQVVVTVSDNLRVRSEPRVSDDSLKYEPLLPLGTDLKVIGGPTIGSGYTWYEVEPVSLTLRDGPGSGWVVAAAKDGEPWIALRGAEALESPKIDTGNAPSPSVPGRAADWTISRLTTNYVDSEPSPAIDAAGMAHVAFSRDGTNPGIYYATNRSGSWVATRVTTGDSDTSPSLVLNASGKVHVAFESNADQGIYYATNQSGTWVRERITTGDLDGAPVLALDTNGKVHVAFGSYGTNPGIYVATNANGSWAATLVTSYVSDQPSIAVDARGKVHLAFSRGGAASPGIYYATNESGRWVRTRITKSPNEYERSPALDLDTSGKVHIAFSRSFTADEGIQYVTNKSGSWVRTRVTASGRFDFPSLVLDGRGKVRIAFHCVAGELDFHTCGIFYATNAGGSWSQKRISSTGAGPLAIDGSGRVHIAFTRGAGIYYGTNASGSWTPSRVTVNFGDSCPSLDTDNDNIVYVAFQRTGAGSGVHSMDNTTGKWVKSAGPVLPGAACPSLALDSGARVHIAASIGADPWTGDVEPAEFRWEIAYATNAPGSWTRPTVLGIGDGGLSLDVDGDRKAHVAFGSYDTDELLYATNRSGLWAVTSIASGTFNPLPSVAVDGAGKAHVAYAGGDRLGANAGIYYATNQSGGWVRTRVTSGGHGAPALALDASGRVHITFGRSEQGPTASPGIYYATNQSGGWVTTRVTTDALDEAPSLAIDGSGKAHIAFTRADLGIYYATNESGSWATTRVTSDASDEHPTLAVDGAGTVHVAFARSGIGLYYAHD